MSAQPAAQRAHRAQIEQTDLLADGTIVAPGGTDNVTDGDTGKPEPGIHINSEKERGRWLWLIVIAVSIVGHVAFYEAATSIEPRAPEVYGTSRVDFTATKPKPVPPPPEPEPVVKEEKIPEPEKAPPVKRRRKPNAKPPKVEPEVEPPKPVFGVTNSSVTDGQSGVSVRVGNTLEKEMELEATDKNKVAPLTEPAQKGVDKPPPKKIQPVPAYALSKTPSFERKVEPVYPEDARRAGIEGTVRLEVTIDAKGRVKKVRVLKSPGHGLDKAAIAAVTKSKFNPGQINGKAVPVKIQIPYRFVLDS